MGYTGFHYEREIEEQSEEDWFFGSNSRKCRALIPRDSRLALLPEGELQRGKEDWQDCATRGPNNKIEVKLNYLYQNDLMTKEQIKFLKKYDFIRNGKIEISDAFNAILSGTTPQGNSIKSPLLSLHKDGFISKRMLPARSSMTWKQYHDPKRITAKMIKAGKESKIHFPINFEKVLLKDFPVVIDEDMIVVAGYAWPEPVNGIYPKVLDPMNHIFLYFDTPRYIIFDNYPEGPGDYIKQLANDYQLLEYGYRVYIGDALEEYDTERSLLDPETMKYILQLLREGRPQEVLALIAKKLGSAIRLK